MEQLNNLDVVFLVIIGISALVGIARGFTKELLSIIGWLVAAICVYYLTPIVNSIMKSYIASNMLSTLVSGMVVLLVVCVFWVLAVDKIASSIRQSKLSPLDRIFGVFFGIFRGIIVVVLIEMMITAVISEDAKKGVFAESKIFNLASDFSAPLKEMIPQDTIDSLHSQMEKYGFAGTETQESAKTENKEDKTDEKGLETKTEKVKKEKSKKETKENLKNTDSEEVFMKLSQPKIQKKDEESEEKSEENSEKTGPKENSKIVENAKDVVNDAFDGMAEDFERFMDSLEEKTIKINSEEESEFGL